MSWKPLGSVLPESLEAARLDLHWATQLVSAAGTSLLEPTADFSHTNLAWDKSLGVLAGRPVGGSALRSALVFEGLELAVLDGDRERASLALAGRTVGEALEWLSGAIDADVPLLLPTHDMPDHPVKSGAVFTDAHVDGRRELAAWFADATALVHAVVDGDPLASPVRSWPHHFDVASLMTFDPDEDPEEARSIGVGFSPGDEKYNAPYLYVTLWPYPHEDDLPDLEDMVCWNTEAWTGAVLMADVILSMPHDEQQERSLRALRSAVQMSRGLLGV
ncbi:MAG: hypothetical protein AAGF92_21990 [Myxococcota bacterium]